MIESNKITFKNIKLFIIGLGFYYLLDISLLFINLYLNKFISVHNNLNNLYSFLFIYLIIIFIYFKRKNEENTISNKLIGIWGYSIIISKIISVIMGYILKENLELLKQIFIILLVIPFLISLFLTGYILKDIKLKILSFLLLLIQYPLTFMPDFTINTYNNLEITYYMYPIYLKIIFFIICIFLYSKIYHLDNSKNISLNN